MPQNEEYGYVYVLKNECMPGLIKIGKTDNLQERMRTLYNSSVPVAFEALYVCKVKLCEMGKIEKALHNAFSPARKNPKREFFDDSILPRLLPLLELFQISDVTDEANSDIRAELSPVEIEAQMRVTEERELEEKEQRKKRPTLNYYDLGMNDGERLYWKDDTNISVIVHGERKVLFNDEVCSLTAVTQKLKDISRPIAPAPYWLYGGKSLIDIYNDKYPPEDSIEE